ncbi:sugar phosphate isomerase [Bacteroidia bacterium]|nr:sugar phosphate isomerase [Bacteroidia bacterium]
MNRREFLNKGVAAAVACYAMGNRPAGASTVAKWNNNRIGIQLYSINKTLPGDIRGSLQKLSDMGYAYAEAYGYNGKTFLNKPLKEWSAIFKDAGMKLSGTHCGTPLLPADVNAPEWDYWRKSSEEMKAAGGRHLVQSFLPSDKSLDDVKRIAGQFNKIGAICKKNGVKFGYHNHNSEFKQVGGEVILDVLLQNTDPSLVFFQMDMGHVLNGGGDILDYMRKYPKRFLSWHASDFKKGQGYADVGAGDVPYDELLKQAAAYGLEDLTVEQETGGDIYASCQRNFDFLAQYPWTKVKGKK